MILLNLEGGYSRRYSSLSDLRADAVSWAWRVWGEFGAPSEFGARSACESDRKFVCKSLADNIAKDGRISERWKDQVKWSFLFVATDG